MAASEKVQCAVCDLPLKRDKVTGLWTHDAVDQPRHKAIPKEEGKQSGPTFPFQEKGK